MTASDVLKQIIKTKKRDLKNCREYIEVLEKSIEKMDEDDKDVNILYRNKWTTRGEIDVLEKDIARFEIKLRKL